MDGLKFEYPLEGGLIRKWECMHLIWTKAFQNLGLSSSDGEVMNQYKLFATESPFGLPNKEDVVQVSVAGCCLLLIRNSKGVSILMYVAQTWIIMRA